MKFLVVFALFAFAYGELILKQSIVDEVNSKTSLWKAGMNKRFIGYSVEEFKQLLGTKIGNGPVPKYSIEHVNMAAPPESFDARTQWPACIGPVRDQGQCGSCWAFGAIEAHSDRFCIHGDKKTMVVLSAQDITSCDTSDMGCHGGWLESAWAFLQSKGAVTEACWKYELPGCTHPCGDVKPTPACRSACTDSTQKWVKYHAKNVYSVSASQMQTEIMTNGPVEAAFIVYEDWVHYQSGVYHHVSGKQLGGHAIKIIGWGVEGGVPYWTVQNSWNASWGDKGYFKIKRGTDECGIESDVVAGLPLL